MPHIDMFGCTKHKLFFLCFVHCREYTARLGNCKLCAHLNGLRKPDFCVVQKIFLCIVENIYELAEDVMCFAVFMSHENISFLEIFLCSTEKISL